MTGIVTLISVATPLFSATLSPTSVSDSRVGFGSIYTPTVICTAVNGAGTMTYTWTRVSGDASVFPNNPYSYATQFTGFGTTGDNRTTVYRCVVTDSLGNFAYSDNVTIDLVWY